MSPFESNIPADVRQLMELHIKSVIALEVLLLLYDEPHREWSDEEVAAKLRIDIRWTVAQLRKHSRAGLICEVDGPPRLYRYYPTSLDLNAAVAALARLYRERPLSMISFIYAKPSVADRLANAFRLRG